MEILARLPAKSVGRFRCVSRSWCAMLSSVYFVEFHRRHANRPDRPRLLLTAVGSSYEGHLHSWQPGGAVERLMPDDFSDGEIVPLTKPCQGLILVRGIDYGGYFVCNPSTGAVLPLPDSKAPLKMIRRTKLFEPYLPPFFVSVSYGLGYCPVRKEHKVVRLFSNPEGEYDMTPTSCEVFVLDAPAYWRPSAEQPPLCSVEEENPAVFLHGRLHFLCSDGGITTFNVSDETFGSLSAPPGFQNVEPVLAELDGSLCVCYGEPDSQNTYHVSVLRDYKEGRWEMLCYIDGTTWSESDRALLKSLWMAPLGMYCSDGEQKIMFGTGACKVFAVDLDGSAPQILFTPDETIIGSCEDYDVPVLGLFEESLVHVGHTIEEMIALSPTTEAWFNILKWLPTRSVLEFGLVCRAWRAMTMMDEFIQSHAVHANLNKSPRIMFIMDPRFGMYMDLEKFTDELRPHLISDLVCTQPCHGLNAGSCAFWDFICNPAIGYCEHISFDDNDGTFFAGRIGLGYNTEINKHIVVHITYKAKNLETRYYELQCKMRHVNEEQWRPVDPPPRPVAATPPAYANGKIYWLVEPNLGPVSTRCEIVAFDVKTHEFEVLQGPPCIHDSRRMTIIQLQGALCVACSNWGMNTLDIWMMKDSDIWLMEYHIELENFLPDYLSENTTPLAVDPKNGQILLNAGWSLGYYDPKTARIDTIYTEDIPEHGIKFCPIICQESLFCPLSPQ
ncbi:hypothetical protein EJB05_21938 [Eragrostis curvula]|uniref:F-box domain-containing protein n=1 Tax=Eragrostis curvula TaxID=38414 RepID=A0A5J9V470_9POAL|nr:hypothetical protein EJB05_21938 [Eragrostis curvula]